MSEFYPDLPPSPSEDVIRVLQLVRAEAEIVDDYDREALAEAWSLGLLALDGRGLCLSDEGYDALDV